MEFLIYVGHIGGGTVGIIAGFVAFSARKGARTHRQAGVVFAVAMIINGVTASVLGHLHDDIEDVIGGAMTIYFVVTAWLAARQYGAGGFALKAALLTALVLLGTKIHLALTALLISHGFVPETSGTSHVVVAAILGFAVVGDINSLRRKQSSGRHRVARHVWRMCTGMFIATGSFFLGQMQAFPEPLQRIELLSIPVLLVILLMLVWLVRIQFTSRWRRR